MIDVDQKRIDALFDDTAMLIRRIAPADVGPRPAYVAHDGYDKRLQGADAYAWTSSLLDMQMSSVLEARGSWQGRGFCTVVNLSRMLAEFDDWARLVSSVRLAALHELAHHLVRPVPPDDVPMSTTLAAALADSLSHAVPTAERLSAQSSAPTTCDSYPAWYDHDAPWIRACLHLAHRATRVGLTVLPEQLHAGGANYGLSPERKYQEALGDEPRDRQGEPIRNILATDPPRAFTDLFDADVAAYRAKESSQC